MAEGRCESVLLGCVEECGSVMESIYCQKLKAETNAEMNLSACGNKSSTGLGEGGVFFLLTSDPAHKKYGAFSEVSFGSASCAEERPDICIMENESLPIDHGISVTGYASIFGDMMTGSGFQCAAAALMLRNQTAYACQTYDAPDASNVIVKTKPMAIREIHCVKYDSRRQKCCIKLTK